MIYRKWSLLSGTMALTGGVIGAVVIANLLFVKEDPFLKPQPQKQMNASSSK